MFSSATTSSRINNSYPSGADACISRFCSLGALSYISCIFFVDTRRCDQYSAKVYGFLPYFCGICVVLSCALAWV